MQCCRMSSRDTGKSRTPGRCAGETRCTLLPACSSGYLYIQVIRTFVIIIVSICSAPFHTALMGHSKSNERPTRTACMCNYAILKKIF